MTPSLLRKLRTQWSFYRRIYSKAYLEVTKQRLEDAGFEVKYFQTKYGYCVVLRRLR